MSCISPPFLPALEIRLSGTARPNARLDCVQRSTPPFITATRMSSYLLMLDVLYDNAVCEKERLVVEGRYTQTPMGKPRLYWKTVFSFVDKYLTPAMAEESVA